MARLEIAMIRLGLLALLAAFWLLAAVPIAVALGAFVEWIGAGPWLYSTIAGYAYSKWRRQCDAEAELEPSLPIARVV